MAEAPRNKGQFVQAGTPHIVPNIGGSNLSVDGMVFFDAVYLQADYPKLFEAVGTTYNEAGDDNATEFRLPKSSDWGLPDVSPSIWMCRF